MHMHVVTPIEAALAGVAITAVASTTATLWAQHFTRRASHTAWLRDHRTEVYEFTLSQAAWWRNLRRDTMMAIRGADLDVVSAPEDFTENPERERLSVRMAMFGEPDVREVFDRSGAADVAFAVAFMGWRSVAIRNVGAARGELPPHQAVEGNELVRLRHAAEGAQAAADAAEQDLIAAVHKAVTRIPRSE